MPTDGAAVRSTSKLFLTAFVFSCVLFWWLPSVLFWLLGMQDPVRIWALCISFLGLGSFVLGYLLNPNRASAFFRPLFRTLRLRFQPSTLDACESLSYKVTVLVAVPALVLAARFFEYRLSMTYGEGEGIPFTYQAVLYLHLFVGSLYLGLAKTVSENKKKIVIAAVLITLPRLIISLRWGRFFLAQAAVPILFIALARGWVRLAGRRMLLLAALAGFLIFVPALTRGDSFSGPNGMVSFFAAGGSLRLFQDNVDLNLSGRCPPLLVSLTAKTVPYGLLNVCTMEFLGTEGWTATLDRILTVNDPTTDEGRLSGTGSNYLLELYLTGGVAAIILGSLLFGFSSHCFIQWIGQRSPFAGIWAECLSRALLAPRSNLGYIYERIPSLVIATLLVLWIAWLAHAQITAARSQKRKAAWLQ